MDRTHSSYSPRWRRRAASRRRRVVSKCRSRRVSRRISELEEELNVRLLERSTRNLRLTEIGAEVPGASTA